MARFVRLQRVQSNTRRPSLKEISNVRHTPIHALVAAAVLARSTPARATLGGPLTVEVLGWSPADERVYVRQTGHDESGGERDCVFYFDLRASDPARPRIVRASVPRWSADAAEMDGFERERAQLAQTLRGLRPLERSDEGREAHLRTTRVEAETTIALTSGVEPTRRFTLLVGDGIHATAWWTPCVSALRRYHLPGRPAEAELVVLSFIGDPFEGGYEVQRCVLMGLPNLGEQRLDSPNGVLPWPAWH
jgi:hypothetical protein